jgi:hypothetical protein
MSTRPSNVRELMAVLMGLLSLKTDVQGKIVQVLPDNITTCAYINHMEGSSVELNSVARAIWSFAIENRTILKAHYIAGKDNAHADALSRLPQYLEWQLHPNLFRMLDKRWGRHTIDRFATMCNTQLPRYNSRFADPCTAGIDALAQSDWAHHTNYVNAPFRLLSKVLRIVQEQGATATVIAPWWPAQPWFNKLRELSIQPPISLPNRRKTFWTTQGRTAEPARNRKWKLYAWRICGRVS